MNESQYFFTIQTSKLRLKEKMLLVQNHSASENRGKKWTKTYVFFPWILSSKIKLKSNRIHCAIGWTALKDPGIPPFTFCYSECLMAAGFSILASNKAVRNAFATHNNEIFLKNLSNTERKDSVLELYLFFNEENLGRSYEFSPKCHIVGISKTTDKSKNKIKQALNLV